MRTRSDAAETLLQAGWTTIEVKSVLGNIFQASNPPDGAPSDTPWWTWVGEDWYTGGVPMIEDWESWLSARKS